MLITPIARLRNTTQTAKALERALLARRARTEDLVQRDEAPQQP